MLPVTSISTAGVPANQKVRYWRECLRGMVGFLDVDPFGANTIESRINRLKLSKLELYQIEGTRTRVAAQPQSGGDENVRCTQILFQNRGVSHFEQDGRSIELGLGDCLIYDNARPFRVITPAYSGAYSVRVPKELLHQRGLLPDRMRAMKLSGAPTSQVVRDFIENLFAKAAVLPAEAVPGMENVLLDLLALPFSLHGVPLKGIRHADLLRVRAKNFIDKSLRDPDLDIETIAHALGCTKRSVHAIFREEGTTACAYVWQSRLELSRAELEAPANSERSITAIALSCGFSSSAHFSRLFKNRFGEPPSALRRRQSPIN